MDPWEKYQSTDDGPWAKYSSSKPESSGIGNALKETILGPLEGVGNFIGNQALGFGALLTGAGETAMRLSKHPTDITGALEQGARVTKK